MATISTLLPFIYSRIDELDENGPVWVVQNEATSAAMEALCDLLLLVGRPDLIVSQPFSIVPNQWMQTIPAGMFCALNMQGAASEVWKITLEDMDGAQVSGPDWEQDVGEQVLKWFPLGFGKFGVWPTIPVAQTVLLTGIASPVTDTWPWSGSEPVNFHDETFQALEKYASHYLRFKEAGADWQESMKDYQSYLDDAKRLTQLENRRDPFIWDGSTGSKVVSNPTTSR